MDNAMHVVEISQSFKHSNGDLPHDLDVNGADFLVYPVERALVHEFHADADIGLGEIRAV